MTSTPEQEKILKHPIDQHCVILAGPGTGKSRTLLQLAARLREDHPDKPVKVVTFTRAATAELIEKIRDDGGSFVEPTTLHSFALSLLLRNPTRTTLPRPLRIADEWERRELLRADLARRLRAYGHMGVTVWVVDKLEREMAAQWESLDPTLVLEADLDPQLRNAYLATWAWHRKVFGYSLFAEMPFKAKELLEDLPDLDIGNLRLLVIDEYQDLNRCEIALAEALASHHVAIVAVGDDDQSIYGFRMAAPEGIRQFMAHFAGAASYTLSVSFRCGPVILQAARNLIEALPGRPRRPSLAPALGNQPGVFKYLRFSNERAERGGIVRLIRHLHDREGVPYEEIAVLLRGDHNEAWSRPLREVLTQARIPAVDVEAAIKPLGTNDARWLLAVARLVLNCQDDLAWWALLKLTPGVSDAYIGALADEAQAHEERFASRVQRVDGERPANATSQSHNAAVRTLNRTQALLQSIAGYPEATAVTGWAGWLLDLAEQAGIPVADDLRNLLDAVGQLVPVAEGLPAFLDQLEPGAKDHALQAPGVSIMTMTRSKGLTMDAAIVMGVEEAVIPSPRASEVEERRLLYVAMTRPRRFLYLTMASRRFDGTARTGAGTLESRRRSPFFSGIGVNPSSGEDYIRALEGRPT